MSQTNSSTDALTQDYSTFEISEKDANGDIKKVAIENGDTKGGLAGVIKNFHRGTDRIFKENRQRLKLSFYILLHGMLIAYFAWATHYFIENSELSLTDTTCTGYGFLMILFIFVNFGICYYWLIKPYLLPAFCRLIWEPLSKNVAKVSSSRFAAPLMYLAILAAVVAYLIYDTADDLERLRPAMGLCVFLLVGFLLSKHPEKIAWRPVILGLLLQFIFGLLTIRWAVGRNIFECLGNKTTTFLNYASDGSSFVYGDFLIKTLKVFAFEALATIFFLGFMINVMYHFGIMQKVIGEIGEFLHSIMGTSICESVNSSANIFLGMSESPLLLKPYLSNLTPSEIHAVMTSGFASVSGTVLAAYISFGADASHLITACVMAAPTALSYSKLLFPQIEEPKVTKESVTLVKSEYSSVLDAASKGASVAMDIVLGIISNIIAFIAFVYFLNGIAGWMGELVGYSGESAWSIEKLVGYIFMPISYLMGVPWDECEAVGRIVGIKTIINEFAAFQKLGQTQLRKRTKVIATYAICGFANPGSIGIMISGLSVLMPTKRDVVTQLVFRAFLAGAIVCFMTACTAGMLISVSYLEGEKLTT